MSGHATGQMRFADEAVATTDNRMVVELRVAPDNGAGGASSVLRLLLPPGLSSSLQSVTSIFSIAPDWAEQGGA